MRQLIILTFIAMLIGTFAMTGCEKDPETIMGPTVYDSTEVIIVDTIEVTLPTRVHAYAVSQVFLDPEVQAFVANEYGITITSWVGHYSHLWDETQIVQEGNTFTLAGTVTPVLTFAEDPAGEEYVDIVEYSGLVTTYIDDDPTDPENWVIQWTQSTTASSLKSLENTLITIK